MVENVSAPELLALLSAELDLVDVRDEAEWLAGHVPGTRNIPLDTLRADPDAFLAKDRPVVFVCARGVRSLTAAKLAERLGYATVYNLDGGTQGWAKAGLELAVDRVARAA